MCLRLKIQRKWKICTDFLCFLLWFPTCVCVCVMPKRVLCVSGRAVYTVELYLQTERALTVGAETQETQRDWILALTKVKLCTHTQKVFFPLKLSKQM